MAALRTPSEELAALFDRAADALENNAAAFRELLAAAEEGQPLDQIEQKLEAANVELAERVEAVRRFNVVKVAAARLMDSLDELIASRKPQE